MEVFFSFSNDRLRKRLADNRVHHLRVQGRSLECKEDEESLKWSLDVIQRKIKKKVVDSNNNACLLTVELIGGQRKGCVKLFGILDAQCKCCFCPMQKGKKSFYLNTKTKDNEGDVTFTSNKWLEILGWEAT